MLLESFFFQVPNMVQPDDIDSHSSHVNNSLEWWSYEALVLLAGLLPNPELETSVISIWYEKVSVDLSICAHRKQH